MIIKLEMMDTFSKSIKTDYNEIILRYLIMYIMIKYYETYPGIGIDNDSLADILVTCYPDDFTYLYAEQRNIRHIKTVGGCSTLSLMRGDSCGYILIIDILENWEWLCSAGDAVETIEYFHSDKFAKEFEKIAKIQAGEEWEKICEKK